MNKETVLKALRTVTEPDLKKDLVTLNMIEGLEVSENKVRFSIVLTTPACPLKEHMKNDCTAAIRKEYPNAEVEVSFTSKVTSHQNKPALSNIKNIIAVISGKGGVGKSTVAVNLAVGLAKSGAKVGLVDGDIHGPSIPMMFGVQNEKPNVVERDGKQWIVPVEKFGVKMVSIGFFVDPDKALIWRGAMITSAFTQIMNDSDWGELDYLIFDTPPGTGDIHLTLVQNYSVTGIVIVSTPQQVALADARKALSMFTDQQINVPVLGIVENMSYFSPADMPDKKYYIFGKEGARNLSAQSGIRLLAEIPIQEEVCESGERGIPAVFDDKHPLQTAFYTMAQNTAQAIAIRNATLDATKIVEINQ
ncbi:MAG: MRP family ATP-binding protein [Bacteroidetes bacterium HGW-Bacteroidetes-6]|jgi:ATP-binding protein involved in chromosome partitioning|nr:MAG: MRP family ATP-binding protein [Bacteroidetes bacterium HGW-Bacteroidetes-6]